MLRNLSGVALGSSGSICEARTPFGTYCVLLSILRASIEGKVWISHKLTSAVHGLPSTVLASVGKIQGVEMREGRTRLDSVLRL